MKHAAPLLILTVLASLDAAQQELVSPHHCSKHRVQFVTAKDSIRLKFVARLVSGLPATPTMAAGDADHVWGLEQSSAAQQSGRQTVALT